MAIEVVTRKWGNSIGIILPKEIVKEQHIKPDQKLLIEMIKEVDLSKIFGSLHLKISGQKFKDLVREGWM